MINHEHQMIKNTGPVVNGKDGGCRDMVPNADSYMGRSVFWNEALFWDNYGLERFMIRSFIYWRSAEELFTCNFDLWHRPFSCLVSSAITQRDVRVIFVFLL